MPALITVEYIFGQPMLALLKNNIFFVTPLLAIATSAAFQMLKLLTEEWQKVFTNENTPLETRSVLQELLNLPLPREPVGGGGKEGEKGATNTLRLRIIRQVSFSFSSITII